MHNGITDHATAADANPVPHHCRIHHTVFQYATVADHGVGQASVEQLGGWEVALTGVDWKLCGDMMVDRTHMALQATVPFPAVQPRDFQRATCNVRHPKAFQGISSAAYRRVKQVEIVFILRNLQVGLKEILDRVSEIHPVTPVHVAPQLVPVYMGFVYKQYIPTMYAFITLVALLLLLLSFQSCVYVCIHTCTRKRACLCVSHTPNISHA